MADFGEFLERLGLLHDCTLTSFEWRSEERKFVFEIEDLYWNFEGLPEYPGPKSGRIVLEDIQRVDISIDCRREALSIFEFESVEGGTGTSTVSVTFLPAGRITVMYGRATFPDIPLP